MDRITTRINRFFAWVERHDILFAIGLTLVGSLAWMALFLVVFGV